MSISEQIETIVNSMTGNNNPPQLVKIRKGYNNNTADVITKTGILKNVKCSGEATAGDEALLIYDNGDMQTPFILLFNGNEDLSDYYTKTEINTILSSYVTFDDIYPVGSIYMSVNSTSPQTLFGGTWVQLQDTFLYASNTADDNVTTAPTGQGEATHTLTENEMPSHTHTQNSHTHNMGTDNGATIRFNKNDNWGYTSKRSMQSTSGDYYYPYSNANGDGIGEIDHVGYTTATNQNKGGGQAHNNMPPYMKVYMWKRTA